jgi:hypothetical protein
MSWRTLVATAAALVLATPAAALSTGFVAQITDVRMDTLGLGVGAGEFVRGSFSHDDCADAACRALYNPTASFGNYIDLAFPMDLQLGDWVVDPSGPYQDFGSAIRIVNDGPQGEDVYRAMASYLGGLAVTPEPAGLMVDYWRLDFGFTLVDDDGEVFDFGYIPNPLPSRSRFEGSLFSVTLWAYLLDDQGDPAGSVRYQATGDIVHLPEPGSAVLLGSGLVGVVAYRRRHRLPGAELR